MQSDDPSWTELSREDEKNVRYWATKVATKSFDILKSCKIVMDKNETNF